MVMVLDKVQDEEQVLEMDMVQVKELVELIEITKIAKAMDKGMAWVRVEEKRTIEAFLLDFLENAR